MWLRKGLLGLGPIVLLAGCIQVTFNSEVEPGSSEIPVALSTPVPSALSTVPATATSDPLAPTTRPTKTPKPSKPPQTPSPSSAVSTEGACGDPTYVLIGYRWSRPFVWAFQGHSVPEQYDSNEVLEVLQRSFENITEARNDCGLPDRVSATSSYTGTTFVSPCGETGDGYNAVGFGEMPEGVSEDTIALTCPYGDTTADEVYEVDVIMSRDVPWALSVDGCRGFEEILEATMTHEVGHVFGLDHVSERRHGDLTMSPRSNGSCSNAETSLGLGDILGLEELYGTP